MNWIAAWHGTAAGLETPIDTKSVAYKIALRVSDLGLSVLLMREVSEFESGGCMSTNLYIGTEVLWQQETRP